MSVLPILAFVTGFGLTCLAAALLTLLFGKDDL